MTFNALEVHPLQQRARENGWRYEGTGGNHARAIPITLAWEGKPSEPVRTVQRMHSHLEPQNSIADERRASQGAID